MIDIKDRIYLGAGKRQSLMDISIPENAMAVVVFVHGYKGFKDWGCWNLVQEYFVHRGIGFVKFNMSHNGGTIKQKIDFPDLEAFGYNTYSKEIFDLGVVITETLKIINETLKKTIPIYLLGHSRGGGDVILFASCDKRISKVVSLAGISDIGSRFPTGEELELWREDGVRYVENARTGQNMPHYFSIYEDYIQNADRLTIEKAARQLSVPFLAIHGDMDTSVSIREGNELALWTNTNLKIIKGADHTFGSSHPWNQNEMPEDLLTAIEVAFTFLNTD